MKHLKSLKVVFAALAVSMVPLFGSCDSGADSSAADLERIRSHFDIGSFDWHLPADNPEEFMVNSYWVWEDEGSELTLESIDSTELAGWIDADEILLNGRVAGAGGFGLSGPNDFMGDVIVLDVQQVDGSWNCWFQISPVQALGQIVETPYPSKGGATWWIGEVGDTKAPSLEVQFNHSSKEARGTPHSTIKCRLEWVLETR